MDFSLFNSLHLNNSMSLHFFNLVILVFFCVNNLHGQQDSKFQKNSFQFNYGVGVSDRVVSLNNDYVGNISIEGRTLTKDRINEWEEAELASSLALRYIRKVSSSQRWSAGIRYLTFKRSLFYHAFHRDDPIENLALRPHIFTEDWVRGFRFHTIDKYLSIPFSYGWSFSLFNSPEKLILEPFIQPDIYLFSVKKDEEFYHDREDVVITNNFQSSFQKKLNISGGISLSSSFKITETLAYNLGVTYTSNILNSYNKEYHFGNLWTDYRISMGISASW